MWWVDKVRLVLAIKNRYCHGLIVFLMRVFQSMYAPGFIVLWGLSRLLAMRIFEECRITATLWFMSLPVVYGTTQSIELYIFEIPGNLALLRGDSGAWSLFVPCLAWGGKRYILASALEFELFPGANEVLYQPAFKLEDGAPWLMPAL